MAGAVPLPMSSHGIPIMTNFLVCSELRAEIARIFRTRSGPDTKQSQFADSAPGSRPQW
jgi:hypothetical protein